VSSLREIEQVASFLAIARHVEQKREREKEEQKIKINKELSHLINWSLNNGICEDRQCSRMHCARRLALES
jgi:hypothetical protein